jgi:hypothetical protein
MGEQTYMEAFNSELEAFKDRIRIRAKEKLEFCRLKKHCQKRVINQNN